MSKWPWLAVSIAVALSGCASVQVQRDRASTIKSVALVGFTGVTELKDKNAPSTGVGNMINGINNARDVMGGSLDERRIAQAETTYQSLTSKVGTATGWTFADRKVVAQDPAIAALLKDNPNTDSITVSGLQRLPDVLRAEPATNGLDAKARAELIQRLGVDAIAVAKVRYVIGDKSGVTIGGMGKTTIFPKAIVEFTVYDASDKPVWRDRWAEGSPTKDGLENTMGAENKENETQVLTAAADSAFGKLVERYQGH